MSSFKDSGNSTPELPTLVMQVGNFQVEITPLLAQDNERKELRKMAKQVRKRYNAYEGMRMELKETLKDLKNWDGTPDAMHILMYNIKDRIEKSK